MLFNPSVTQKQKPPSGVTSRVFPFGPTTSGLRVEFTREVLNNFIGGLCLGVSMLITGVVAFTISVQPIIAADFYLDDATPNLWLDAGAGVSGTSWADQSGNDNNATKQGSPTLVEDALNGKSVMRYSGANGEFHSFANMNNIRTVFWVLKATDGGGNSSLLGDNNQYHFHPDGSRFWSSAHTNGNVMNGALRQNGLSKTGHIDSKPSTYAVLSFLTAGNVEASNFFSDRNIGGRNFKGDLAELAIFDVALTDSQIAEIEGNLAWKYSLQDDLATDHAWKYNDPANPARATITIIGDLEPPFDVAPVPVSVTFSFEGENTVVTGFDQDDVIVTGADLSNFSGSGHTYTFIVTPTAEAGQITVSIPDGSATDGTHDSFAGFMVVDYARFFSVTRMNDLVGWWSFDDDTANDKSGNDHHGVASATDIYSEETAFGRGKSINLNGDKYITVSDGGDQSTFDGGSLFSISFWTKEWPDVWGPFLSKRGERGQGWQVRRRQNSADQIAFTLRGPGNDDWSPARNINDGQWHHLVATWGGGKRVLYVDGAQIGSENRGGKVNPTGSQLVFGGRDNSGNAGNPPQIGSQSNVWLDDIRFYRASLTAEDVGSIYNNGDGDFNDPPALTLAGEAHLRVPVSTDFVDPGATATDTEDGDLDDISVITLGDGDTVDTSRVGDWKLFYTVKDSAGSSASVTRTIRIFDPEAPVLTLNGNAEILHEAATQYNDAGATVVDQDGNALDAGKIDVSGLPPEEVPSEDFVVTYNFKDDQDRVAETITRTVKVVDTTKPLLTIEGDEVVHHQVGAIYLDKGATATDTLDGELVVMDSLFTPNQLDLSGWLVGGRSDGLVDLDENGGVLTLSPVGSRLFNKEVYFNGDASFRSALHQINRNDDFQIVVSGYFQALSAGEYEFGTEVPDDRSSFWIDLDGDGVFSTDGLKGNERTTQADARGGYSIVSLDPGFYKVAIAYSEHAGGARIDARYRSLVISDEPVEPTLWLDASNAETLTMEGGKVSIWKGVGEGQVEVTQGVDGSRPVVGPEINGRNTITFDGNDFLDGPAVLNEGDDTYTYIALWRPHRNAVQAIYEQAAGGNGRRSSILHVNTHYGFNGQGNDAHNLFPVVPNEWRLTGLILNGADTQNIVIIDNDSAPKTANLNINNLNVGADRIRVAGKATNNGERLQGEIAELRIFDSALSSRDLTHHMKDIKERWALDNITITEPTLPPPGRDPIHPGDPAQAGQWGTGNPVNIYQEGTYTINYTATDAAGNIGSVQRTVIVEYIPGAPIITLKGDAISTHEGGTAFVDPGARLRDSNGVPLDHSQIVAANVPDGNVLGDFFITYNYTDENGQAATEILRKVTVIDTTVPSISLNGEAEIEIIQGADYIDLGVTSDDVVDPNPSLSIISSNPFFTTGLQGGYVTGNLNFTDPNPLNIEVNPLGPTASEQKGGHPWGGNRTIIYTGQIYDADGKISFMENIDDKAWLQVGGQQILDDGAWNVMTEGQFEAGRGGWFDFELRISNGGGGFGKVGNMGFGFDPEGGSDFILPRNFSNLEADLFRFAENPASFDTGKLGSHTLTYTVIDSSGNASTVSRTVVVIPSPTIPLITLEGENEVAHEAGEIFTDPGYNIKDASGNLLPDEEASVGGDFDPSIPGSYTVTYDYTDGDGNEALQVSRKVTVSDTRAPTVMLDGDAVIKIEVGSTYSDPGFSATDIVDGDIPAYSNIEYFPNSLDVSGYMEGGRDINLLNFDQDGGLLSIDPVGVSRFSGDITAINGDGAFRAIIPEVNKNDDYQFVFHGFFQALVDGDYEFGIDNADDRCSFWIDLDQDGVFESDGDYGSEVIFTNFSGGGWKTHNLATGVYRVAIGFMEFGGGAWVRPRVRLPGGGRLGIHPSNANQNGYWFASPTATLDINTPGSYTIEYTATDSSGNQGKASRIVNVVEDISAPSIVLLGEPMVAHDVGQEYTDAGGNIVDSDGELIDGEKATVNVDELDTGKPGTYNVTLTYATADGSAVTPVKRIVKVVDAIPPTLILKGEAELKLLVGDVYDIIESPGATFSDNVDPDRDIGYTLPPLSIPGLVLHLDASFPGENYKDGDVMNQGMSDLSGKDHHADNIFGNPTWKADGLNGRPTISFDGDDMIWTSKDFEPDLANHTLLTLARYTGGDNERVISTRGRNWFFGFHGNNTGRWYADGWIYNNGAGDTEWHLHIGDINNKDQANFWKDGVRLATNSTGANNNTYKPTVIQLGGWEANREMSKCEVSEVILFDRVLEDGERNFLVAYLVDKYQLNVPVEGGRIDTSAPGSREFVYTASDSSGNTASVTRTIIVEEDNDPPVITLAGDAVMYITPGTEFIDPGVTATDRGKEIPVGTSTTFPKEQLLALYAFNDPANPGFDSSLNSADAEVRGGVTSTAEGRFGAGIELNGTDAFLVTPLDGHHNVDFSWTAWIKTTDGNGGIVGISQDNWSQGGKGVYVSGGRPKIDVGWVGNGMGAAILNDGSWHHVAFTVKDSGGNSDPYIVYVDGEVDSIANIDWFRFDGTGHDLRVGHIGINDGQFLAGTLDDVAIYQKILSQEEIQEMMQGATVIDTNVSAAYPLTYTATDLAGNQSSITRMVVITDDPEIPYIALNGQVESVIELGSDYADPGAKAYDKAGQFLADITATQVPDGKTLGEFEIVYAFQDASGKDALPAKRILQVIDTTSPVVTLNESAEFGGTDLVTFKAGQAFVDPGVTFDDLDSSTAMVVTHKISPDAWFTFDDEVNPGVDVTENGWDGQFYNMAARSEEGRYGAGLLISSLDSNSRFEIPGNGFPLKSEWTATAWFKKLYPTGRWRTLFRGRNTDHQVMFANNSDLLGNYANGRGDFRSSGFSMTPDESKAWRHIAAVGTGNETRFYIDGQLVGASDQKGINTIWQIGNHPGQHFAKYIDDVMLFNRALSEQEIAIAKGGNQPFDTTKPGAYSLLYTVTDSSGNTSQAFRKVVVEEDTSAPVITLIGKPEVTHEAGEEYRDHGAFVSTADGEPLLNEGLKTETDLSSVPGTYTFTYTFTDEKGSVAIPVTRSIKVIDTSGPVITLVGASPITLPRGEVYDDPGALAEDNVDGIVPVQVVGMTQTYVALDIGPLAQRVQDGWIGVSGGNNDQNNIILPSQEVVTPDGHTLTIQISSVDWRDRGDSTSSAPLARVAEDFVKNNAGDITLTLTGLPEGDYVFTTYHLDVLNAQSEQINVYVTDANGQDVLQGVQGNANLNPGVNNITEGNFGNTSATFKIKSDGVDPIEVRLDGQVPDTEVPINALVIETPVVISAVGEYLLTYSAMDSLGHRSEITRTVIVSDDATIPSITLLGDKEINLEAGNAFGDPGITLKDRDGNDLDASLVQVSGKVLSDVPGIYVLAYDYADADGKVAVTRKRTITVGDSIAPAITLNGAATIVHILGEPYQDAGATAVDTVSGVVEVTDSFNFYSNGLIAHWNFEDLTDDIARDQVSGQHGVMKRFDLVTDHIDGIRGKALNFDGVDNRIDVPVLGRNPSEFTVSAWLLRRNGNASSIFHTKGWEAGDLHFIVQNDINFAFNGMGQQSGGGGNDFRSIDQLKLNEWTHVAVAYSLNAKQAQIYIDGELLRETTFTGTRRIMLKDGLFIGAGQNGTDRFLDGALDEVAIYDRALNSDQVRAVMDGGQTVDVRTEGQYTINFTAHDASGNKAMATRTVIVTADPDAPVITLLGNAEIAHEAGNPFEDPGATVADKDGNALEAASILVGGEVKSDTLGQYTLTYDFTDDAGGKAMQILRKVTIADTLAPVITLIGDKETRISINAPFTDPGATAKDLFEGDIQVQANIPIPIDTNAAGDYEIIYTATDSVGNKAEIKRTVKVLPDTTPPVITLVGESTMTINLGSEYDEDGAIAEDNIDGILTPFLEDSGTVDAVDTSKEGTYIITYDVSDSAGNKAVQVTRTVIVKSSDPFDNWLEKLPVDQRAPDADPDKDGVPNLLEFALGGNPAIADRATVLPTFDSSGGSLKLTFIHLKASIDPNLNYMPEITSSLKVSWSPEGLTTRGALQGVPQDNLPDGKPFATSDYARATVTADTSMDEAGSKQFLRLTITRE